MAVVHAGAARSGADAGESARWPNRSPPSEEKNARAGERRAAADGEAPSRQRHLATRRCSPSARSRNERRDQGERQRHLPRQGARRRRARRLPRRRSEHVAELRVGPRTGTTRRGGASVHARHRPQHRLLAAGTLPAVPGQLAGSRRHCGALDYTRASAEQYADAGARLQGPATRRADGEVRRCRGSVSTRRASREATPQMASTASAAPAPSAAAPRRRCGRRGRRRGVASRRRDWRSSMDARWIFENQSFTWARRLGRPCNTAPRLGDADGSPSRHTRPRSVAQAAHGRIAFLAAPSAHRRSPTRSALDCA